jgi:hypothetical protein
MPRIHFRAFPRVWLFAGLYVFGIIGWWWLYYAFRGEFVVNPEVLRVEPGQVRGVGRRLIGRIEAALRARGDILAIEEPLEWVMEYQDGRPRTKLQYRLLSGSGANASQGVAGSLVVVEVPGDASAVLVRPTDAREGTETIRVPFEFRTFERLVTRGYDSPGMSALGALYFSTTTITTLGLGDIVPKSDTARFLVVTQVIYGLLVFVFLANSLVEMFGTKGSIHSAG